MEIVNRVYNELSRDVPYEEVWIEILNINEAVGGDLLQTDEIRDNLSFYARNTTHEELDIGDIERIIHPSSEEGGDQGRPQYPEAQNPEAQIDTVYRLASSLVSPAEEYGFWRCDEECIGVISDRGSTLADQCEFSNPRAVKRVVNAIFRNEKDRTQHDRQALRARLVGDLDNHALIYLLWSYGFGANTPLSESLLKMIEAGVRYPTSQVRYSLLLKAIETSSRYIYAGTDFAESLTDTQLERTLDAFKDAASGNPGMRRHLVVALKATRERVHQGSGGGRSSIDREFLSFRRFLEASVFRCVDASSFPKPEVKKIEVVESDTIQEVDDYEENQEFPQDADLRDRSNRLTTAEFFRNRDVIIVGVGGVGSWLAYLLGKMGAKLTLIDPDEVESSNLARTPYRVPDIGSKKVSALYRIIRETSCYYDLRNLHLRIHVYPTTDIDYITQKEARDEEPFPEEAVVFNCKDNSVGDDRSDAVAGYDGNYMTFHSSPSPGMVWGDEDEGGYQVTPSFIIPPIIIACGLLSRAVLVDGGATREEINTVNINNFVEFCFPGTLKDIQDPDCKEADGAPERLMNGSLDTFTEHGLQRLSSNHLIAGLDSLIDAEGPEALDILLELERRVDSLRSHATSLRGKAVRRKRKLIERIKSSGNDEFLQEVQESSDL